MTDSITPPPKLVQQWVEQYENGEDIQPLFYSIFQDGANQELEACCKILQNCPGVLTENGYELADELIRAARRPKPPSLKEQALTEIDALENMGACNSNTIRRALEALPE